QFDRYVSHSRTAEYSPSRRSAGSQNCSPRCSAIRSGLCGSSSCHADRWVDLALAVILFSMDPTRQDSGTQAYTSSGFERFICFSFFSSLSSETLKFQTKGNRRLCRRVVVSGCYHEGIRPCILL